MKTKIQMGMLVMYSLLLILALIANKVWATASSETGDTRAFPVTLYGTTSGGSLIAIQVDSNGIVQLS